jgi:hypothetical protein
MLGESVAGIGVPLLAAFVIKQTKALGRRKGGGWLPDDGRSGS